MVIWKRHVENISQLNDEELAHYSRVYQRAERFLLELTGSDRAIMLKLGIATPHLPLPIYPVIARLDRAAVMVIIEGWVRDPRYEDFG